MLRRNLRSRLPPSFPPPSPGCVESPITVGPLSLVRLVRHDVAQLVAEDDKVVLYHCAGNTCRYQEAPEGRLAFSLEVAGALEHLMMS